MLVLAIIQFASFSHSKKKSSPVSAGHAKFSFHVLHMRRHKLVLPSTSGEARRNTESRTIAPVKARMVMVIWLK